LRRVNDPPAFGLVARQLKEAITNPAVEVQRLPIEPVLFSESA
jgi:hypothetical protein